jgi:hypothetical protein
MPRQELGAHVFDIIIVTRVYISLHNYGEWVVDTTGAKAKNKINDLCILTGYSGALIANGNFQRRPPHPSVRLGCQLLRKLPRLQSS